MDYEKKYKEAVCNIQKLLENGRKEGEVICAYEADFMSIFPELKESEDERIRTFLYHTFTAQYLAKDKLGKWHGEPVSNILAWLEKQGEMDIESYKAAEDEKRELVGDGFIKCYADFQDFKEGETYWLEYVGNDNYNVRSDNLLGKTYHITPCQLYTIFKKMTWLEKQGTPAKLSEEEQNRFAKGVLTSCAMSFIDYLDVHKYEGKMCVSNGECEDIENAFHNAMWDKLHRYYGKYIEKQGKQKQDPCEHCNDKLLNCHNFPCIKKKAFEQGKSTLEVTKEEKVDNANKVEPKFKVRDWIIFNGLTLYIKEIVKGYYRTISKGGITNSYDWGIDNTARLWTIQDAKDGDVLATEDWVFIFKKMNSNGKPVCYCHYDIELGFRIDTNSYMASGSEIYPATKEQRDLLFQKMSDAGYAFDFDKKELKKIEQKPAKNEELTEFDKAVGVSIGTWNPKSPEQIQSVKAVSKKLLKLAKKQINDEQKPTP